VRWLPPLRRPRRSLPWLVVVAAFGVALLAVLLPVRGGDDEPHPLPTLPPAFVNPDPASLASAALAEVIDGDTIDVRLEHTVERVRYYGVDTPERGEDCYEEATARNRDLLGSEVLLLPDARERDRYGRLLRYVFTLKGQSVGGQLVAEGLALAWRDDGAFRGAVHRTGGRRPRGRHRLPLGEREGIALAA
jgi:endonuclease YncB( thermonuclease family)